MSIILAEAEKGRIINVFQALAMNIYESLLTCLQKSDGVIIVCTMVDGVGQNIYLSDDPSTYPCIQLHAQGSGSLTI